MLRFTLNNGTNLFSVDSAVFTVLPPNPAAIVFSVEPNNGTSTSSLNNILVSLLDEIGNVIVGNSLSSVSLNLTDLDPSSPPGRLTNAPATLLGSATVTLRNGVANFSGLSITKVGTYQLTAAVGNPVLTRQSRTFLISAGPSSQLQFIQQPTFSGCCVSTGGVGVVYATMVISPALVVRAFDAFLNPTSLSGVTVRLSIGNDPTGQAVLSGATNVVITNGIAQYDSSMLDRVGTGFTLVATAQSPPTSMTAATTAAFNVLSPEQLVSSIAFTNVAALSGTVRSLTSISPSLQVSLFAANGSLLSTLSKPPTDLQVCMVIRQRVGVRAQSGQLFRYGCTPDPCTVSYACSDVVAGVATFSGIQIDNIGNYSLHAMLVALGQNTSKLVESPLFSVLPGSLSSIQFTLSPPSSTPVFTTLSPAPQLTAFDQGKTRLNTFDNLII